ncbi:unnamed protein product [Amaranthus hypochondriacus]
MRGGRAARGRGGRGRGEEHCMTTRSGSSKTNSRAEQEESIDEELAGKKELDNNPQDTEIEEASKQQGTGRSNEVELQEELKMVKEQLTKIFQNMEKLEKTPIGDTPSQKAAEPNQTHEEEYPALRSGTTAPIIAPSLPLQSWKD